MKVGNFHRESGGGSLIRPAFLRRFAAPAAVLLSTILSVPILAPPASAQARRVRRKRCLRKDKLVPLKYIHGGHVWIPKEIACTGGRVPVLILLHGNNPYGRMHKYLGGGKRIDRMARRFLNKRLIQPVVLASPIHHAVCKKAEKRHGLELLWSDRFSFRTYRRLLLKVLRQHRIRALNWSLIGHSGAGCCPQGGLFAAARVWRRLRVWATADTCYGNSKYATIPIRRFKNTRTVLYNACRGAPTYPGYPAYARLMYTRRPKRARCDRTYYKSCIRHPFRRWRGFVTKGKTVPGHGPVVTELIKTILWRHFPSRWRRVDLSRRSRMRYIRRLRRRRVR